jgi:hypothetical protein
MVPALETPASALRLRSRSSALWIAAVTFAITLLVLTSGAEVVVGRRTLLRG